MCCVTPLMTMTARPNQHCLAAFTRIPVFGEAAVGGEWLHITSELSQARLWRWGHAAILRHRRDLMRGCGKQA